MSRHRYIKNLKDDDFYDAYSDNYYCDDEFYDEEGNETYRDQDGVIMKEQQHAMAQIGGGLGKLSVETKMAESRGTCMVDGKYMSGNKIDNETRVRLAIPNTSHITSPQMRGNTIGNKSSCLKLLRPKAHLKSDRSKDATIPVEQNQQGRKIKLSPQFLENLKTRRKSRLSVVVVGHVDVGKSTLMGQLLFQLGFVQQNIVNKYKKQASEIGKSSCALAWIMDEDDSERQRGVTMDIATKVISTNKHHLTILDVPGHADYVPAMITGAASADVGIVVVAATPNEFESGFGSPSSQLTSRGRNDNDGGVGQTREHIILARGLGISQLVVAVNKLDATDPPWSQNRFVQIQNDLTPFLKFCGFNMKRVQFIPISGLTGVNVKTLSNNIVGGVVDDVALSTWYDGPTLVNGLDLLKPAKHNIEKPLRFIVSDVYAGGKGVTVKGRVVQGILCQNSRIVVLPTANVATVHRVDHNNVMTFHLSQSDSRADPVSDFEQTKVAIAGDYVDVVLVGIDISRIAPGNVISNIELHHRPPLKKKIQASILLMDNLRVPIIEGAQVLLHMHSLDMTAVISKLISVRNRKDKILIKRPRVLSGGANATVEIKVKNRLCVEGFDDCPALGRIVLRQGGSTIAIGIILGNGCTNDMHM